MTKQYTLGKNERLKSRKEIEQLFNSGKRFSENPLKIFFLISDSSKQILKMGVGVSSKNFKKAVERNRIKRQIREAWRLQKKYLESRLEILNQQLNVFIIYTGREIPATKQLTEAMKEVMYKLEKIIERKI